MAEMTSTCWTLWQRMPSRYQLTVRTPDNIEEGFSIEGYKSPRTPRQTSRDNYPTAMLSPKSADESPRLAEESSRTHSPQIPYFPNRKSGYIDNYKSQQRVNSARMKLVSDPASAMPVPGSRAKTAPSVPLTKCSNRGRSSIYSQSSLRPESKCRDRTDKNDEKVSRPNSIFNFDEESVISDRLTAPTPEKDYKKYIVKELPDGTMYIDNGKIIFYKKHRHDVSQFMKTFPSTSNAENGGFLASIRHEYLRKPKHVALQNGRGKLLDQRFLQRQRIDYNKKAGHILDYYSIDDEDRISMDDLAKFTKFQPTDSWRGCGSRQQPRSATKSAKVRKLRFVNSMPEMENSRQSFPSDHHDDPGQYLKLNSQSKLHDRNNFYLRTPGFKMMIPSGQIPNEIENCHCGMCRLEMLMAHFGASVTQLPEMYSQHVQQQVADVHRVGSLNADQNMNNSTEIRVENTETKTTDGDNNVNKNEQKENETKKSSEQKLTITVPAMNLDREISDLTTTESVIDSVRIVNEAANTASVQSDQNTQQHTGTE